MRGGEGRDYEDDVGGVLEKWRTAAKSYQLEKGAESRVGSWTDTWIVPPFVLYNRAVQMS